MATTATTATTATEFSFSPVGDGSGLESDPRLHAAELHLALRNHALPLEALRRDVTPTGLHDMLVHYDIPAVDAAAWRLTVGGAVRRTLALSLDELRRRPARAQRVTRQCAGDGRAPLSLLSPRPLSQPWFAGAVGTAEWTGTPLRPLLEEAGLDVAFTGLDRGVEGGVAQDHERARPRVEALHDDVLLAWAMNGRPLEPQYGFPLRLIVPGWYGMASVKWLCAVTALAEPFAGYQQTVAYRYSASRAEAGEPVTLMRVRSLMVPPGVPDFLTRARVVERVAGAACPAPAPRSGARARARSPAADRPARGSPCRVRRSRSGAG